MWNSWWGYCERGLQHGKLICWDMSMASQFKTFGKGKQAGTASVLEYGKKYPLKKKEKENKMQRILYTHESTHKGVD